ncbi:AraC-type DNA-binding protein [Chitinophaga eiseniae]|uniref:AraC-type DNA-binding protein n=1 Tax=Chitinophaga eiseniae TaxID=634771 RepID=A0A1T4MZ30_9BACT|nr:AraC family transcriptional regulator [Chitinophaga eiseniae]SJZ72360.1 AraC-type DNA-binding protein [Chitinophaga eiseniae]
MTKSKSPRYVTPPVFAQLAKLWGVKVKKGRIDVPAAYGTGYCAGCVFNENIRMLILHYRLNEETVIGNPEINTPGKTILFKFQHIDAGPRSKQSPSVLIATSRFNTDAVISIQENTSSVNIEIAPQYLEELFTLSQKSPVLQSLAENAQPLLFEQMISPAIQKILHDIISESVEDSFKWVFRKIKAEELICMLLMKLEERQEKQLYPLKGNDVQTIYDIKARILSQLDEPPVINDLAIAANMSPTKLRTLFRQIFGDSIFEHYQKYRMQEAARLLKEGTLSVSEVGYQLGFSNLSHFSRVFEAHIGMKPKKFSISH